MNIAKLSIITASIFILIAFILRMSAEKFSNDIRRTVYLIEIVAVCLCDLFFIINVFSTYIKFKRYLQMTVEIICALIATIIAILTHFNILANSYSFIAILPIVIIVLSRILVRAGALDKCGK